MVNDFELDEIVWAKVSGYPWWPGFIASKIEGRQYEVVFLSDLSRAFLSSSKIRNYTDYCPPMNRCTSDLEASQRRAENILNRKITLIEIV